MGRLYYGWLAFPHKESEISWNVCRKRYRDMRVLLNVNYSRLKSFRQTSHPSEEIRIQREIDRLKAARKPFGYTNIRHISRNAQVRILEELARAWELPHPRLLVGTGHFEIKLPGWKSELGGLYRSYADIKREEGGQQRVVDFMLDYLGVEPLEALPLDVQIKFLKINHSRIIWARVSKRIKRRLIERLAEEAKVLHPRILNYSHFRDIVIPEIGSTLITLYTNYAGESSASCKAINDMLDDVGIPAFDSQPWEKQLECLRQCKPIKWNNIPESTQLGLLEMLKEKVPAHNGIRCPHLRMLTGDDLKDIEIEEIGKPLGGLLENYRLKIPRGYKGTVIDYMLDHLKVEKFEDLSYDKQCLCLRYDLNWSWKKIPEATVLRFLERVKELNSLPHLRYITADQVKDTFIPELGRTLHGLYIHCLEREADDEREIVDMLLDRYGVEPFSKMLFHLQVKWASFTGTLSWSKMSGHVISYYFGRVVLSAEVSRQEDLRGHHFERSVAGKEAGMSGLLAYLNKIAEPFEGQRVLDWAWERFGPHRLFEQKGGLQEQIRDKRHARAGMLDEDEKSFLVEMAKAGNREALDHLIFFYEPMIKGCARRILAKMVYSPKTQGELEQDGRVRFYRLVKNFDISGGAGFTHYARGSLMLYMLTAIFSKKATRERRLSTSEKVLGDQKMIGTDQTVLELDLRRSLEQAIKGSGLTEKENFVLRKRYLEDVTQVEFAKELDRTQSSMSSMSSASIANALKKIAKGPYAEVLRELL